MACACKVNKDLTYLQKKYGKDGPKQKQTNIIGGFKDILVWLLVLLAFPFMIIHVIVSAISGNGKISIAKIVNIKKHSYS